MVKVEILKSKEGETLVTADGKELYKNTLEVNDELILMSSRVIEHKPKKDSKGFKSYSLLCKVKGFSDERKELRDKEDTKEVIFIDLTPGQVKNINSIVAELGDNFNQKVLQVYSYHSEEFNKDCLGIGIKRNIKKAVDFETEETVQ